MTILLKLLFYGLRLFPVRLLGMIGAFLGRLLYLMLPKFRHIALRNLRRVYPDRDASWHRRIARECFSELGRNMFELPHVFLRSRAFLCSRISTSGLDSFLADREQHGGAVLVSAHHGNWELGGLMVSVFVSSFAMIYRPMKHAAADAFLRQCRERFGMQTYSRFDGIRWLPGFFRQGGVIAIMADQHMSQGMQVPFMGHMACTTTLPAVLAMRQKLPVYVVSLHRQGHEFRFQLRFEAVTLPELTEDKSDNQYRVMQTIGEKIASIIDERPEMWLWIHKRWWILEHDPDAVQA